MFNIRTGRGKQESGIGNQATQCIWLAQVRPEEGDNLFKCTILQGKIVKSERQLRGARSWSGKGSGRLFEATRSFERIETAPIQGRWSTELTFRPGSQCRKLGLLPRRTGRLAAASK